jgi:fibronectin-binding autotransporter adhesin
MNPRDHSVWAGYMRGLLRSLQWFIPVVFSIVAAAAQGNPVSWIPDADGQWTTATNWSSSPVLPGSGDDVTISVAGDRMITLAGKPQSIRSLASTERLTISTNSSLTVGITAQLSNTLTLNGTLIGGAYTLSNGASIVIGLGILDGVSVNGTVDMTTTGGTPTLELPNGLTLNGTLNLGDNQGGNHGRIDVGSTSTSASLTGTGTIVFGTDSFNGNTIYSGSMLTIGNGFAIRGKRGQILNYFDSGKIVNQGTITEEVLAGVIIIGDGKGTFVNQGALSESNGATLTVNGSWSNAAGATLSATSGTLNLGSGVFPWSNAGTITANSATVNLGGTFTQAAMGTFNRTGGTVNVTGTMTGDLALGSGTGSWNLNGGTLRNVVYSSSGGSSLGVTTGTFDGVTVNGALDMTKTNGASLTLLNGLTLNGTLTIGDASTTYGEVDVGTSVAAAGAISGTGTIVFGGYPASLKNLIVNRSGLSGAAGILTIGSGITIRGKTGSILSGSGGMVNQGTISGDVSGSGLILIQNDADSTHTILNQGTLSALNGGQLSVLGTGSWSNAGNITASSNSIMTLRGGSFVNSPGGIIELSGGTLTIAPTSFTNNGTLRATGGTLAVQVLAAGSSAGDVTIGNATFSLKSDLASPVTFAGNVLVTGDTTINSDRISVGTSGVYRLGNVSIGSTRLSVTGANRSLEFGGMALSGSATLNVALPLTINGPITQTAAGMGIIKSTGVAKLTLGGNMANTYTGLTRIDAGSVELNKPSGVTAVGGDLQVTGGSVKLLADQQIADTGAVSVANAGSLIDFAGHAQTMGAFSVTGNSSATVGATGTASQLGTAVLRVTSLTVNTGGKLDLANNRLIDDYSGPTPITSIRTALSSGYANGAWNGPGIQSSSAIANPTRVIGYAEASDVLPFADQATSDTFLGSTVDKTALLMRYALTGDANLDGVVDFLDLSRLAQSYNVTDGTRTWAQGDYNYDGNVDFIDLAKLAQNYNTSLLGGAAMIPAGAPAGFEADLARAFAEVPEPGSLGLILGAFLLAGRRSSSRRAG